MDDSVNQNGMAETEKMLSQSEVNKLVGREKAQAAEQARQEMQAQQAAQMAAQQAQQQQAQSSHTGQGGQQQQVDPAAIEQQVYNRIKAEQEQAQAQAEQAHYQQVMQTVANNYKAKMEKGSELFDDFQDVTSTFEPHLFPEVVYLASEMENTPNIMYELAKNPQKLAAIHSMAKTSPVMAKQMLERLSKSIGENEEAKSANPMTNPPLSRTQSSTKVGADSGKMTLRDLKASSFLRG